MARTTRVALQSEGFSPIDLPSFPPEASLSSQIMSIGHDLQIDADFATLKETIERFRSIIDSTAEGIVLLLADGSVGAANTSAVELLGLTMDELMHIQMGPAPMDAQWEDGRPVQTREVPGYFSLLT